MTPRQQILSGIIHGTVWALMFFAGMSYVVFGGVL